MSQRSTKRLGPGAPAQSVRRVGVGVILVVTAVVCTLFIVRSGER
jgi:hypothetical protein